MKLFSALLTPIIVTGVGILGLSITHAAIVVVAFGIVDTHGRLQDYRYLSRFKYIPDRLADFYGRSMCGRRVIGAVSQRHRRYYRAKGYRPWHILPDGFPSSMLNLNFWRALWRGHPY